MEPISPILNVDWLGQVALHQDGVSVQPAKPSRKADVLLAYLAMNTGIIHERSKLMDMLCFNVKDPASDFRGILKRAREMAGENTALFYTIDKANGDSALRFEPKPGLQIDAVEFRKPLGHSRTATTVEDLMHKAALYGGPFMPGYESVDAIGWVVQMQAGLNREFCKLMEHLLSVLREAGRWNDLITWAEHWISRSELPLQAYRDLMLAYKELGDLPNLNATYARYTQALTDLGVTLDEELREEYQKLREALIENLHKREGDARRSPLPKALPKSTTSFVGRAQDLANIARKLDDAECQLVTVLGIGGVGKTRLALRAAQEASDKNGYDAAYVNMGLVKSDEDLATALTDALNFVPYGQEPLLAQVQNYLREKRMLIVFDAFEHAIQEWAAGPADGVQRLDELLNIAPGIKALVTTRERLNLLREHVVPIEGMDYPPAEVLTDLGIAGLGATEDDIKDYGAVKLFMQTAKRVREFSLRDELAGVVRICRHAQGLPLAIDLAAAHVAGMSAADIADAIDASLDMLAARRAFAADEDPRHRSVRATFEYSWGMLPPESQRVYAQLSIFPGSFSLEAAKEVLDAPLRVLSSLVSNTLLRYDFVDRRYDLHDLLRQFGSEKLQQQGNDHLVQRMADYYLSFARRNQKRYDVLELEWGNFLAAIRAAHGTQRWETVMDFADTLTEPWFTRARFGDARQGFGWALESARAAKSEETLAFLLIRYGKVQITLDEYADAEKVLNESLAISRRLGNKTGIADAEYLLAQLAIEQSDLVLAEQWLMECQVTREQIHDIKGIAETLFGLATIHRRQTNYETAELKAQAALDIQLAHADFKGAMKTLGLLAEILSEAGNQDSAESFGKRSLAMCIELNDEREMAQIFHILSYVSRRKKRMIEAEDYAHKSLKLFEQMGDRKTQGHVLLQLSYIYEENRQFEAALAFAENCLGLYRVMHDDWCVVYALLQTGDVQANLEMHALAKQHWEEGRNLAKKLHHPLTEGLDDRLDLLQKSIRTRRS